MARWSHRTHFSLRAALRDVNDVAALAHTRVRVADTSTAGQGAWATVFSELRCHEAALAPGIAAILVSDHGEVEEWMKRLARIRMGGVKADEGAGPTIGAALVEQMLLWAVDPRIVVLTGGGHVSAQRSSYAPAANAAGVWGDLADIADFHNSFKSWEEDVAKPLWGVVGQAPLAPSTTHKTTGAFGIRGLLEAATEHGLSLATLYSLVGLAFRDVERDAVARRHRPGAPVPDVAAIFKERLAGDEANRALSKDVAARSARYEL
eukprot:1126002-Prymnesium_polylepis.1